MSEHCHRFLRWEVLSATMAVEEPDAFDIIQVVLNFKHNTSLMEHEVEHLNGLATVIQDTGRAGEITEHWESRGCVMFRIHSPLTS